MGFDTWSCWGCGAVGHGSGADHWAQCQELKSKPDLRAQVRTLALALNKIQSSVLRRGLEPDVIREIAKEALAEAHQEIWT